MDKKKNKKKIIVSTIAVVLVLGVTALAVYLGQRKKDVSVPEESTTSYTHFVSQDTGRSFYAETDKKVLFSFGKGNVTITDKIKSWKFGQPMVSLTEMADVIGYTVTKNRPAGYAAPARVEYYDENEPIDLANRVILYVMFDDTFFVYTSESGIVLDAEGNQYNHTANAEANGEDDMIVSIEALPFFAGDKPCITDSISVEYLTDATVYTLLPQENAEK